MNWYYAVNGQRQGPVAESEIEKLASAGVITAETLVWCEGMTEWKPYSQLKGVPPMTGDTEICAVSGKRYLKREMIQYEGKWISAEHRDAYFQRMQEGVVEAGEMVYATMWPRIFALLIDGIAMYVANTVSNMVFFGMTPFGGNQMRPDVDGFAPFFARLGLVMLLNTAMNLAYVWFFLARYEATPGKMALGLKVVRSDGSRLSNGRIIGRFFAHYLSGMILYIGFIIAIFDKPERKALHDIICDTRVIKAR